MIVRKCHRRVGENWVEVPCPELARPAPGLGDAVAAVAKAAGLRETTGCGCARRRAALNRLTPRWISRLFAR